MEKLSFLNCLIVFSVTLVFDALCTLDTHFISKRKASYAAITSGLIVICGGILGNFVFNENLWYILPETIGAMLGAYLTIKYLTRVV